MKMPRRAAALAALLLAGCADSFVFDPPEPAQLVGDITVGTTQAGLDCGPMRAEVSIEGDRITGRAFQDTSASGLPIRAVTGLQPWWLVGDLYENGVAVVTLFQSTTLPAGPPDSVGAKPISVFRGTVVGNRLDAAEQQPSCGRRLVAEAAGA